MRPSDPRLRMQLAPARRHLVGVAGAGVLAGLLVIGQAWAVAGLVIAAVNDGDVARWGALVASLLLARGVVAGAGDVMAARAAAVVATIMRHRMVVAAVSRRDPVASGERAVLITRGVAAIEPYLTRYVPALVVAAVLPPLTVVAIATQDLLSAVIVLATLPLVPVFGALVGLATRDRAEEQWRAMASLSGHFVDVVRGLPTLVAHRRARAQSERIAQVTHRYRVASLRTLRIAFASSAVLELVATLSVALVAVTIGVRLASGSVGLQTALVVLLLAPEAYWPLRRVGAEFHAAAEGAATFEAAHGLIAAEGLPVSRPDRAASSDTGLVVHDLRVTWSGRRSPALALPHAVIPAHGITAVTGPSGCGKSTLLYALADLLPTGAETSGEITAGNEPVGGSSWRRQVGWVPQQPRFVAGSIADNLRLARGDASDSELWAALRQVALEVRIQELPDGIATPLGEDGATLSAGERARLALARVVLAQRPWVLLDEPTAHLDDLTEQVIADTIVELARTSAVVVVAHRPRLVELADHQITLTPPEPATSLDPHPHPSPQRGRATATTAGPSAGATDAPPKRGFLGSMLLGTLASASGVALTATAGWLIVQASTRPAVLTLLVAIVGVRTFGLARPALRYVERLRAHDDALRLLARRRVEVYDALVPLVPARLGRRRGELLSAVVDDVDSVVDRELRVRMPTRQFVLVALLATGFAAVVFPQASAVVLAFTALAGAGSYLLARAGAGRAERHLVALRSTLSSGVVEAIQVADELTMWGATTTTADRIAAISAQAGRVRTAAATWQAGARALVLVSAGATMLLVAHLGRGAVADGSLSGPMLALLVLLPLALVDTALPLADAGALAVRTDAAERRIHELRRTPPAVRDTVALAVPDGHGIAVDQARARWQPASPLGRPLSLSTTPGDRVAVTGPSGSGKSTLAALLLRFLDPAEGTVLLGSRQARDLWLDDVRRLVGLVDDHPHVFSTTLVENVRLARPTATDAEVEDALRRARLGDWLESLPAGLGTWLGDGHAAVSGGERARIAIARSLLADQPVLVLDEPTAHLDHATACALAHEVLDDPASSRSVVWITHSGVGLELVDRIVDLGEVPGPATGRRMKAQGPPD